MAKIARARPAAAVRKRAAVQRTPVRKRLAPEPPRLGKLGQHPAREKAELLAHFCKRHGWDFDVKVEDDTLTFKCSHEYESDQVESFEVTWSGTRQNGTYYTVPLPSDPRSKLTRTVRVRNAGALRAHVSGKRLIKRDAQPRQVRKRRVIMQTTAEGVTIELPAATNERVPDAGVIDGKYRVLFSDGTAKYHDRLPVGWQAHAPTYRLLARKGKKLIDLPSVDEEFSRAAKTKELYESLGYKVELTKNASCEGCDTFGCQETRPGAWAGPKTLAVRKVKRTRPPKRSAERSAPVPRGAGRVEPPAVAVPPRRRRRRAG